MERLLYSIDAVGCDVWCVMMVRGRRVASDVAAERWGIFGSGLVVSESFSGAKKRRNSEGGNGFAG